MFNYNIVTIITKYIVTNAITSRPTLNNNKKLKPKYVRGTYLPEP